MGRIQERLRAWTPPMLRPVTGVTAEDERAFTTWAGQLTRQLGLLAAALMVAFTAGWWLLDPVVMPDAQNMEAFAALRARALVVEGLAFAAFLWVPMAGRQVFVWAVAFYAALIGAIGYSLGELGGPDLSWLANTYLGLIPLAVMPLAFRGRVAATLLVTSALLGSFFLPFPENRALPRVAGQLSFAFFAVGLSLAIGEMTLRVIRTAFFQRRAAAAANSALKTLTDSLSATVAERTADLRALAVHLDEVQDQERRRIARALHDDLGQNLTAMRYTVARLEDRAIQRPEATAPLVQDLSALIDGTSQIVRGFLSTLRPRILEDLGLVAAAEWLAEHVRETAGVPCDLTVQPGLAERLTDRPKAALVLFRILQEATTNALKHAEPERITLDLALDGGDAVVEVRDDGRGFDVSATSLGFGLLGLTERLRARGGRLEIDSGPGGTCVRARLPLDDTTTVSAAPEVRP